MTILFNRRSMVIGGSALSLSLSKNNNAGAQPNERSADAQAERFGFGWIRDLPNLDDASRKAPSFARNGPVPNRVDLANMFPEPYDQGRLGSCTANAIAGAIQYSRRFNNKPEDFVPSRLFIYYQERKIERTIYMDAGAQIRHGIASVAQYGVCPETLWEYDNIAGDPRTGAFPQNARSITAPPQNVMDAALPYHAISYARLNQSQEQLEACLAKGYPFVFGFSVYDNFRPNTKLLKTPGENDQATDLGHAVVAVGYDRASRIFRIRNSWGKGANDHGYFDMEYDYVLNSHLSSDFWVIYETLGAQ